MKKNTLYIYLAMFVSILIPLTLLADAPATTGDPDAPIDGGLSLLIVAGAGYGVKKLKERRANKEK
jgi:hypothetical protein